ncbi:DUF397 domain-containing protein [Kitasatospora phosalacinea]|uniref:DUF397 domain-containing protein n=1 Tax=Kitasatospora phosalacinea TaxID=2065 RepID=A0ABW6GMD5_9ACTN
MRPRRHPLGSRRPIVTRVPGGCPAGTAPGQRYCGTEHAGSSSQGTVPSGPTVRPKRCPPFPGGELPSGDGGAGGGGGWTATSPSTAALRAAAWHKSSYSGGGGECVEMTRDFEAAHGLVFVRDSKDPEGAALAVASAAWRNFATAAARGVFGGV